MGFLGRYVRQTAEMNAQRGTLNIMLETEVQSLDPQVATDGTSFEVIADYTDGLMQMDADGAAVPAIAETYDISEDGKTYTCLLYTSPSPRDISGSRMPSSA